MARLKAEILVLMLKVTKTLVISSRLLTVI
jgi:hypothetical protein